MVFPFIPFHLIPYQQKEDISVTRGKICIRKFKENYQLKKKELQSSAHCLIRSGKLSQPTKEVDCPLVFKFFKKMVLFPENKIEKNTQRKRIKMGAKLNKEITALSSARFFENSNRKCLQRYRGLSEASVYIC